MLTGREVAELFAYVERNPIDDQSNFHLPLASFQALFANANRAQNTKPANMRDFLFFRDRDPEADIEDELLSDNW
jgi:hypothetical protein